MWLGGVGRGLPPSIASELRGHAPSVMLAAAPVLRRGLCRAPRVGRGPRVTDTHLIQVVAARTPDVN